MRHNQWGRATNDRPHPSAATASHCDQVALFPGDAGEHFVTAEVFDTDGVVSQRLWETRRELFRVYVRYYASDHRPLWA